MLITSDKVKSIMINNKDPVEYVEHQEAEWEDYSCSGIQPHSNFLIGHLFKLTGEKHSFLVHGSRFDI